MTVRLSSGVRNALAQGLGFAGAFNRGCIQIYSGTQPATADSAVTGTLLGTVTLSSGAYVAETQASGTITITGGSTSILTVTVGTFNIIPDGAVPYNTSTTQTASDLADAINRNAIYTATVSGAVVTIRPRPGVGDAHNGLVVTSTGSVTATYANISGGTDPVSGLTMALSATGVVSKPTAAIWSFNGVANGTAGWFRLIGSVTDAGASISAAPFLARVDGSIATSGADMNLSNISITTGAPNTIDTFSLTIPAA
jgi:hypothetical protein